MTPPLIWTNAVGVSSQFSIGRSARAPKEITPPNCLAVANILLIDQGANSRTDNDKTLTIRDGNLNWSDQEDA